MACITSHILRVKIKVAAFILFFIFSFSFFISKPMGNHFLKGFIRGPISPEYQMSETKVKVQKVAERKEKEEKFRWGLFKKLLKKMDIEGDLRIKSQWDKKGDRVKKKIELRFGVNCVIRPTKRFKVGFGLSSMGKHPRSRNVSFDNLFKKESFKLDNVYLEYFPLKILKFWVGKYKSFQSSLWEETDLLWDRDLRPKGIGAKLMKYGDEAIFLNGGIFFLKSDETNLNSFMVYFQDGAKFKFSKDISFCGAFSYYNSIRVRGNKLKFSSETNSVENNRLKYDYNVFVPEMEVVFSMKGFLHSLSFYGEFVHNFSVDLANNGFLFGTTFGWKKINRLGKWQVKLIHRKLERDAWLDSFPDSGSFEGKTEIEGNEIVFELGLYRNLIFKAKYYRTREMKYPRRLDNLLKTFVLLKF